MTKGCEKIRKERLKKKHEWLANKLQKLIQIQSQVPNKDNNNQKKDGTQRE